ncbi:MAG: hypothetical protein U0517_03660 [Candidatus Andersenbacteria bacterium]
MESPKFPSPRAPLERVKPYVSPPQLDEQDMGVVEVLDGISKRTVLYLFLIILLLGATIFWSFFAFKHISLSALDLTGSALGPFKLLKEGDAGSNFGSSIDGTGSELQILEPDQLGGFIGAGSGGTGGATGKDGAPGADGPAGPAGASGSIGPQGVPGVVGAMGPQGPAGADGATGADGADGATGATGATGPAGPPGPPGAGTVTSVTAGSGLSDSGTATDPVIDINDSATNGLAISADILTINDNGTNGLSLVGDVLTVATGNGLGLSGNSVVAVAADATISVGAGGIAVGVIGDSNIAFGVGVGTVSGADLPIADVGGFYTTNDVESALAQIQGADITSVTTGASSGLEGGVTSGVANLSLLTSCAATEILKWSGAAWLCSSDANSGGTVTSVTAGSGLGNSGTAQDPILDINDSGTNGLSISADVLLINDNATNGLTISGDTLTVATGNGLGLSGNSVVAVAADATITVGAGGVAVGTIGDTNINFGTGAGQVSAADLPIADAGNFYTTNDVESALAQIQGADITSVTTAAGTGLEGGTASGAAALSLLTSCGANEILKWTGAVWACAADNNSGGTVTSVTAGAGLVNSGTAADPIIDIGTGSGITVNADNIALGPLTADWNQTGAFDISLNNASSELKLLESAGATFFGTLDVGDLAANATYTLSGSTGTILTDANYSGTLDPIYVNVGESPAAGDITGSFTAGLTVGPNAVALGTDTINDYVASFTAGAGLTGNATGEGSTPTIDVVSANGGIVVNAGDIALTAAPSANGLSATTSSGSGLEILASGVALLQGCADTEILKWNEASDVWTCSADGGGSSSNSFVTIDTPSGTDPVADSPTDTVQLIATGTTLTVTGADNPETITFDLVESVLAGAGLVLNGEALDIGSGSGVTVNANDITLGPLTADWNQTGAFDISLNNASSELKILESAGATFFGTLDVGDLAANATYTLSGSSGTLLTDANYSGTLDPIYVNVGESPAAGDISGSFSGGLTVNANSVALGTDTTNDYVASFTAGAGLTGNATGEGSTPTIDVVSANGGIVVNAGDIALTTAASANGLSSTTSSGSGLEILASGVALLQGCADTEILKWNETSDVWACSSDSNTPSNSFTTIDTPAGTDPVADSTSDTLQLLATGTSLTITGADNPETITFDVVESVLAGAGLAASGSALDIGAGSGITVNADDIALGPLTADWNQTGAFDVSLNNASSELKILESAGATFFGTLDVGDLAANATYTLSGSTGTILTDANYTGTLDAVYVNVGESPAAGDITGSFSGGLNVGADAVALGTDTTGNYVASLTAGAGLTGNASGEGSTPTIDVVSANGGIVVNAGDIALTVAPSANGLSSTTSSGSGLEILGTGVTLLQGCADTQILKWDETNDVWACAADSNTVTNSFATIDTPAGTDPAADSPTDTVQLLATGTTLTITGADNPETVTFDLVESALAGAGLALNGEALDIGTGSGITVNADNIALGPLTADWNQTGAFDISLNNASSELKILESAGATFFGTLDVGDLAANATYTLSGSTGTILTDANYTGTLDAVYVNVGESPAAGDITGSFSGGLNVGADAVALSTDTTGNYVATLTAGGGLTGTVSSEGSTPTVAVGAGSGITVNADDIALGPLTADWNQTGAFDISLNNASSELKILESAGATFFGTLDVGDLAANATYTLSGSTGTILTDANYTGTLDSVYVNVGESPAAGDITGSFSGGLTVGADAVALTTDTTGNYVASFTAGAGLTGNASGEGSTPTIDVVSANGGIVVNAGDIALTVAPSANGLSSTTSSGSGMEILASGVALLQGCADTEILKWNEASDVWACSADSSTGTNSFATIDTPAGTDPVADSASDTLQLLATGTNLTITGADNPETITFDISESTLAGAGLAANGSALDIGAGSGITVNANDIALGPLTADWNQTGAFDISLNNASSELKILESAGATFFGTLDVGDLAANATYTLSGSSGTVLTDANYTGTLDAVYVNVGESPAAGDITGSFSGGLNVGADAVALTTDTTGNYVATLTAGGGLTGTVSSEGSTPTVAVGAGSGITVNADDIALGPLTADWNQTGAFDISLNNASSELKILESAGATFFGTLDVGDLAANATYTLSGSTGTILTDANYTGTLDSVYVNVGESPAAGDITGSFSGGLNVGADAVALTTDTTGSYVASFTAGAGLTGNASGEGSTPTIDVVSANGGIVVNAGDIALTVAPSANGLSSTTSSGSGMEILASGVALLQGCADTEILKWNEASDVWACSADSSTGTNSFATIDTPAGTDPVADSATDTVQLLATGTNLTITGADNPETITFDISESTLAGAGLAANGSALDIGAGSGITVNANDIALGPLTADWNQTGAFDISLNNASSELKILESAGATFFGTLDVGDLAANATYTLSGSTGTILTDANYTGTLDAVYVNVGESPAAGDITGSFSGGLNVGADAVALTTDTTGNYVATLTAGGGLTGTVSSEGSTPTVAVGAGSGITVNADDIALGPLTADWNQTGAFDISLNNASSELKILESAGATFFGTLDVGDLSANATYTLSGSTGTILTDANYTGTLDSVYVNVGESPAAGDITGSFSGGLNVGADAVALTTDTTGNYVATLTAGGGLTGTVSSEGSTPTVAVGAGSGITVNADDIALGPLTADWNQTGAFDISLNNASSELKILESAGATFFGTLDVGDLAANATYTLSGSTGTILTDANYTGTLDSVYVNVGESPAAADITGSFSGGLTVGADSVALTTDTTGSYVASFTAGAGLTGNASGEGSTPTIDVVSANGGIVVNAGDIALTVAPSANGLSSTTSSGSGMEILASGVALLQGCADTEVLKWNEASDVWACGTAGTSTNSFATIDTPSGTDPVADTATDTLQLLVTGTNLTITGADNPETATFDISESTLAGAGLAANGSALDIGANSGITVNANDIALGPLTADWNQTGAFDISLNNASSELKILESAGATFFGTLDVGDLAANATYTFSGSTGTVLTDANYTGTLDSVYVNVGESPAAADITGSFSGGLTVGADSVALTTDTTGNYVATLTAGGGLTGTVSSEGSTPTVAVGAGSGITVNADDIALGPLTADWNQTGAFDISLNNASSELKILESAGATFFGTVDVGDLSANATYTLSGSTGTVLTDANYTSTLDSVYVNVGESPAAGDITGSFSGGLTVGADSVALTTDTTGNYVASFTAGAGLTGNASGEGSTPTIDVVSANGGIVVNAGDIALTVAPSANGLSSTTSSGSGMEILASGVALLQGCADTEILKWNETSDVWACGADVGVTTLQGAYNGGATITTAGSTNIAFTLTSGNFNASGAGSVNLTPTAASQFTSSGALTFTAGAASTWSTSSGALTLTSAAAATWSTAAGALTVNGNSGLNLNTSSGNVSFQPAGSGTTANVQIGAGGSGSTTPDLLGVDVKSVGGGVTDPTGFDGAVYYSGARAKFRCFENGAWKDCDTSAGTLTLPSAYDNDVDGSNVTIPLTTADDSIAIQNPSASGTDSNFLFQLDNQSSTDKTGLRFVAASSTSMTTAIDASATNITNALDLGGNTISGSTAVIDFTNFDVSSTGQLTFSSVTNDITTISNEDLNFSPNGSGNVTVGTSDTTGTLVVLDTKTGSGDPTGTNGAMYYNSNANKMRCYENGAWGDCLTTVLYVSSDVSQSTTTFADVTGLTTAVTSGFTYVFSCDMTYTTAVSTTALQLSLNGPTTTALDYEVLTDTTATAVHNAAQTAYDTNTNPATGGGATRLGVHLTGSIIPSANGTLAVRYRSEVATSAVTVKRGSFCTVSKK